MSPDGRGTGAPNQTSPPQPARPDVTHHAAWRSLLPRALSLDSVASAAFPGSFTTKPPQEPYPSINQTDPAPFPSIPGAPTPPPGGLPLAAIPLTALPTSSVYPQTPKLKQHRQNHTHTRTHACTRPTSSSMLSLIFVSSQHQMHSSVSSALLAVSRDFGDGPSSPPAWKVREEPGLGTGGS